jgi:hypothetical protein
MKIRRFNEDTNKLIELESFCKMYLAELIDEGCSIKVDISAHRNILTVSIFNKKLISWDNIKDIFMPFLQMLDREYIRVSDIFFKGRRIYPIEQLLSSELDNVLNDDYGVPRILFNVKV